jgi:micrococcal nuclease
MNYLLLLLLMLPSFGSEKCLHTLKSFQCVEYVKNYDGDTITFNLPGIHPYFGKKAKLRVQGIDTPEIKPKGMAQPCETEWGRVARKLVEAELKHARRIDITNLNGRDKYGRILGQVVYDGKNLKDVLLKNHLAVPYEGKRKKKTNWCELKALREKKK